VRCVLVPALLFAVAWWAYSPGLSGGFLFDDFNNLNQIGAYGRVDNLRSLVLYLTSGSADPTGRPLSLLSFLVDARDWPADPEPFKRSNILLHLFNGALLAWTLARLGRRLRIPEAQAQAAALLGSALWMLHPLLVSTTLYIVQREAMLPATLALTGMLLWLEGGERLASGRRGALACLALGSWGCAILAALCKANGVLLPLLLLSLEWAIPLRDDGLADATRANRYRRICTLLLGLPSGLLAIWMLGKVPAAFSGETYGRPWTIGQRLLSEGRVVCDYLGSLWLPRASAASVFNDGFRASTGWLHPWTTLPALGAIALLLGLGFILRRRHPALAFAIAFYFAGQLLESTLIPLELYFEHRNYLPALPMFWPLALWLTGDGALRRARAALAPVLCAGLALLCHTRAGVWGKPYEQALLLAQMTPDSPRAQANAAAYEMEHGRPDLAAARLEAASRSMPDEVQIALNWIAADCARGTLTPAARDAAHYALEHDRAPSSELVQSWLTKAINDAGRNQCPGLDLQEVDSMLQAIHRNPNYARDGAQSADLQQLQGLLDLARNDGAAALQDFNRGLTAFPTPDRALLQAALLGSAGLPAMGLEHLRLFKTLKPGDRGPHGMQSFHLWLLERDGYWSSEFAHMEKQLDDDLETLQREHPAGAAS
jgi:hypothetical protein